MTNERLTNILGDPSLLATISYEELKTLALSYPYAHNLRVLLAIKAQQEGHPNFKNDLGTAALYTLDRKRLFQVIAPKILAPQPVLQKEEVLELEPIAKVKKALESKQPAPVERAEKEVAETKAQKLDGEPTENILPLTPTKRNKDVIYDFSEALRQKQVERQKQQIKPQLEKKEVASEVEKKVNDDMTEPLQEEIPDKVVEPKPEEVVAEKSTPVRVMKVASVALTPAVFGDWAASFKPPVLQKKVEGKETSTLNNKLPLLAIGEDEEGYEDEQFIDNAVETSEARSLAAKSVTENEGLVSETLAKLYVRQGYITKAVAMYERLCLAFPEKSAFFAAEIEKLKK